MKSIWQGSISFGLISIPIRLYSAVEHRAIKFKLLHKKDKSTVRYKRVCEKENKEVEWQDLAKGIEISKDHFYVISQEELDKLKPEKSDFLDIIEFVDGRQIDPIYFDNHYFIAPAKAKDKAYFLFREVLQLSGKVAIGRFVMRNKEYTSIISSYKKGLLLTTLNYQYEIRDINQLEELKEEPKIREEELGLAKQLIAQLTKNAFDMSEFKDNYEEQLKVLLRKKEKGEPIVVSKKGKAQKEEDLIAALKASLK
jgi:DNA end-binding protein Ku